MTNKEAAKQIARSLAVSDEYPHDYLSAYAGALQAIKWKEKQIIDKAWDWLTNQKGEHTKEDFIKAMKGE